MKRHNIVNKLISKYTFPSKYNVQYYYLTTDSTIRRLKSSPTVRLRYCTYHDYITTSGPAAQKPEFHDRRNTNRDPIPYFRVNENGTVIYDALNAGLDVVVLHSRRD